MQTPRLEASTEIRAARTFGDGLLLDIIGALDATRDGELFAIIGAESLARDLEAWSNLTGHSIIGRTREEGGTRWVLRRSTSAHASAPSGAVERAFGDRLWLYTNFDCNLSCDYCCVRSSPTAPRRELDLDTIRGIAREAPALGVRQFFVTGGEPLLRADIADILNVLVASLPTTVLTNASLVKGAFVEMLRRFERAALTFQVSLDSATPELHDLHRGRGTWERAARGIDALRALGFRVRIAATVSDDAEESRFAAYLDAQGVAEEDRVIRRLARRGLAHGGVALGRVDLVPEITITREGVFWHPLGADDDDLFVTRDILPLAAAFDAVKRAISADADHGRTLASVFHCA